MAEGFLQRSDLSKILSDAREEGYNDGKNNASGIGGIPAVGYGVQNITGALTTYTTKSGGWGYERKLLGTFDTGMPSNDVYIEGRNALLLHLISVRLYISSKTGYANNFRVGFLSNENGAPIRSYVFYLTSESVGQSYDIGPTILIPVNSNVARGPLILGEADNIEATTTVQAYYSYQWYILGAQTGLD